MFNQVKEYISKMRELGYSEEKIRKELTLAGWSEKVIQNSLNNTNVPLDNIQSSDSPTLNYSRSDLNTHNSLIIGFLYVLNFISLWIGTIALILALFTLIDRAFVPYNSSYPYYPTDYTNTVLNGYIAALIVSAPIFLFLFVYMKKQITLHPEYRLFKLRKILIIITLIVAFCTLIIDFITIITSFLNGDISWGSVLKVLCIVLILIPIFIYYYNDISQDRKHIN